jgi:hypothetical protein
VKPGEIRYKLLVDGQPLLSFGELAEAKRKALDLLAHAPGDAEILVDYAGHARSEILRWDVQSGDWRRTEAIGAEFPLTST